jgi:protein O-GlcNAc transferase
VATVAEAFALACQCHQSGNLLQAEDLCQRILKADPTHADTHHLLGILACQTPGKLHDGVPHFQNALRFRPDFPEAHANMGNAFLLMGKLDEAAAQYQQALRLRPLYADAYCNLGSLLIRQEKVDEAIRCYRQALQLHADSAEICNNLGLALQCQDNLTEANHFFRQALKIKPDDAGARGNLADVLFRQGQFDDAIRSYQEALHLDPHSAKICNNLGLALMRQNRVDEAVSYHRRVVQLSPEWADAHCNLGSALLGEQKFVEAAACFRQALRLNSEFAEAHNGLGMALAQQSDFDEARNCFLEAIHLSPNMIEAHANLGIAHLRQGRLEEAVARFHQALGIQPHSLALQSSLLFCLNYDANADLDTVFAKHCDWGRQHSPPTLPPLGIVPDEHRRLRVGYVSPDLRYHALTRYFEPVLAHHDPKNVEVFCYAEGMYYDTVTLRLQKLVPSWRWTSRLSDAEVIERIREDKIDILVDLAGHTANNRLSVFAHKPAPVQVTWLGYMNTTGLKTMDYRLTDSVLDPPGQPVRDTEELVRLPGGMCCFAPPLDAPPVAPLPALRRGHLTFGSLHGLLKLNSRVFDVWGRVLQCLPTAHLLMFHDTLAGTAQERIRREFGDRGVAPERLDLRHGSCASGYLETYSEVDVSLDAFPWTGGVTTCESLWMGVPMITLCGTRPAGRSSAAILARVGLSDWAVQTPEQFVAFAMGLEYGFDRLAALRCQMRDRMIATLCDGHRFTRELEKAYRTMWLRYCAKQPGNIASV